MKCDMIHIEKCVARNPLVRMNNPFDLSLCNGEQIAIMGPNGGGKTLLVDYITGRYSMVRGEVSNYNFL